MGRKLVYDRHFYYFNMTNLGFNVNLFNMVRDPVERMISHFYYIRKPLRWKTREVKPPTSWFEKSFDDCVLNNDPECLIGDEWSQRELQMRYFCECDSSMSEEDMIRKAMYTVENDYSVVGVLEMFNTTLDVLDAYIPGWFQGARRFYPEVTVYNHNPHPLVSTKAQDLMKERLKYDIEFYEFLKQRLLKQKEKIRAK